MTPVACLVSRVSSRHVKPNMLIMQISGALEARAAEACAPACSANHDHPAEIQHLSFRLLGAERPTFVCAVDISPFRRKTTRMQFAAHVLRRGGMEPEFSHSRSD